MGRLFRKVAMERVTSPEQLNDYIRVSNPSVWLVLAAILILVGAASVWGIYGTLDTTIDTIGYAENEQVVCYLTEEEFAAVADGVLAVRVDGTASAVTVRQTQPLSYEEISDLYANDPYALYALGIVPGEWRYRVELLPAGTAGAIVDVSFLIESTNLLSFITN
ncbi:MAG: hypothetical protein GX878_07730 [Firmicutes bacterium]|nr:hypothetical protein [Bacillota bacterium]